MGITYLKDQRTLFWFGPVKYLFERSIDNTSARANQAILRLEKNFKIFFMKKNIFYEKKYFFREKYFFVKKNIFAKIYEKKYFMKKYFFEKKIFSLKFVKKKY